MYLIKKLKEYKNGYEVDFEIWEAHHQKSFIFQAGRKGSLLNCGQCAKDLGGSIPVHIPAGHEDKPTFCDYCAEWVTEDYLFEYF